MDRTEKLLRRSDDEMRRATEFLRSIPTDAHGNLGKFCASLWGDAAESLLGILNRSYHDKDTNEPSAEIMCMEEIVMMADNFRIAMDNSAAYRESVNLIELSKKTENR